MKEPNKDKFCATLTELGYAWEYDDFSGCDDELYSTGSRCLEAYQKNVLLVLEGFKDFWEI